MAIKPSHPPGDKMIMKAKFEVDKQTHSSEKKTIQKAMRVVTTARDHPILLHMVFCSMVLLATITTASTLSTNPSNHSNSTKLLQSLLREAVNSSACNLSTPSLASKLIGIMQDKGVILKKKCKPQTLESLSERFLNYRYRSSCVDLTRLNITGEDGEREATLITTNSDCVAGLVLDRECFQGLPQCTTRTTIDYLGDDYFPKFILRTECGLCDGTQDGCRPSSGPRCTTGGLNRDFKLLKRVPGECDADGREIWELESQIRHVSVACSCFVYES